MNFDFYSTKLHLWTSVKIERALKELEFKVINKLFHLKLYANQKDSILCRLLSHKLYEALPSYPLKILKSSYLADLPQITFIEEVWWWYLELPLGGFQKVGKSVAKVIISPLSWLKEGRQYSYTA